MDNKPNHVAIILDGNRRWAKANGLPVVIGHRNGLEATKKVLRHLRKKGIHTVTIWAFSTENWKRTKEEIGHLMRLFEKAVEDNLKEAEKEKVQIVHIGRKDRLPKRLVQKIEEAEERTKSFTKYVLNIALDYGGRDEIVRAAQKLSHLNGSAPDPTQQNFSKFLDTKDQKFPDADIVLRTGGAMRLSGFMVWQAAYAELFFIEKGLPALTTDDIDKVLEEYAYRQRRFGK